MSMRAVRHLGFVGLAMAVYWLAGLWLPFASIYLHGDGEQAAQTSLKHQMETWPRLHFLTRTDRIAVALQKNPWVDRVSVYKSFDGSLRVRLNYKRPIMRAITGRYLIDSRGYSLATHVSDDLLRLPVFSGEPSVLRQAHRLWVQLGIWQSRLLVISHDGFSGWELLFDNKVTVRLGTKKLSERLLLFLKVADHWSLDRAVEEQVFDMRYNNSFTHKKLSDKQALSD